MDKQDLIKKALQAREKAYAPYSGYRVGAALLTENGDLHLGCNVENSSFSETVCAERVAFLSAVSSGAQKFKAIAIVGGKDEISSFAYPCGACRQVMSEFCKSDFEIILYNGKDTITYTLDNLLPFSFSSESIK